MADTVYLVRHAAPPPDMRNRYWGKRHPGVVRESLEQAASLASALSPKPDIILSSGIERAVMTADVFAEKFSLDVALEPDLAEIDFGFFDGMTYDEAAARYPDAARQWLEQGDEFAFPGGESIPDFYQRIASAWRRICSREEQAVLVVAHAGPLSAFLCLFLELPFSRRFCFRPEYAALTALSRFSFDGGWELKRFNAVPLSATCDGSAP